MNFLFGRNKFKRKRKKHLKLGKWGEKQSCKLLESKGFEILTQNFRLKSGELDIVALDGRVLVFVEVKTLTRLGLFRPVYNYSYRQNKRNIITAKEYIRLLKLPIEDIRFDFIEVVGSPGNLKEIRHYQNFTVADTRLFFRR